MIQPDKLLQILKSHNISKVKASEIMFTSISTFKRWVKLGHTDNMDDQTRSNYEIRLIVLKNYIGDFKQGESLKGITHTISAVRYKELMKWGNKYKEVINDE